MPIADELNPPPRLLIGPRAGADGMIWGMSTHRHERLDPATPAGGLCTEPGHALDGVSRSHPTVAPIIVACLVTIIWGATPVVTKVATGEIESILFLAVMTTIVGYIGWYWALAAAGIARIGTIQFFQPVSGLVLAIVVLGERFTLPLLVASVTILAGVFIAQRA